MNQFALLKMLTPIITQTITHYPTEASNKFKLTVPPQVNLPPPTVEPVPFYDFEVGGVP